MFSSLIDTLSKTASNRWYWLILTAAGFTMLATALFFQYGLDELPCVLCIQVRLWVSLLVLISLLGFYTRNARGYNIFANLSVVAIAIALAERSYQLLGTERGFLFGDCGFSLGLPSWFAIDDWLPWLYRIETSCGYTPEIAFGITMAEALIVLSVLLLVASVSITSSSLFKSGDQHQR